MFCFNGGGVALPQPVHRRRFNTVPEVPEFTVEVERACRNRASTDSAITKIAASAKPRNFCSKSLVPERVNCEISKRYKMPREGKGVGSFGKVFVGEDREADGRFVAIKRIMTMNEESKQAFQKEALIMKELDHPNICKIRETYDQGRSMYIVMEYCEGGELLDEIMTHGTLSESKSAVIIRQVASALKYAHSRDIAHRDLKPENICFTSKDAGDHHVMVIDWGVGFYFGLGRMMSKVGSGDYAAPEIYLAEGGYTAACDLWSLGVVLYVMLSGRPPFWGNPDARLMKMINGQYPLDGELWNAISLEAKSLIKGLLIAKPSDRMSIDQVLVHPWLKTNYKQLDTSVALHVLTNMRKFSTASHFCSMGLVSLARQLDHHSLRNAHRLFREMDTNGDGVLSASEVKSGFQKIFGEDSDQLADLDELFQALDLDGSGQIDYTEFCAASLADRVRTDATVLRAAFKTFDVGDDGFIDKDEIVQALSNADVNEVWSYELCEEIADEVMAKFDHDGNGVLDFNEWLSSMRECEVQHDVHDSTAACVAAAPSLMEEACAAKSTKCEL